MLSENEPVRRRLLRHASHSVCRVADHQAEPEADATSAPCVALAFVLCESMTAVGIAHLPHGVSCHGSLALVAGDVGNMLIIDATEVGHL